MTMEMFSALLRSLELKLPHQMQFNVIRMTVFFVGVGDPYSLLPGVGGYNQIILIPVDGAAVVLSYNYVHMYMYTSMNGDLSLLSYET